MVHSYLITIPISGFTVVAEAKGPSPQPTALKSQRCCFIQLLSTNNEEKLDDLQVQGYTRRVFKFRIISANFEFHLL